LTTINIITLIAVILFARLGVRLFLKYRELKKENELKESDPDKKDSQDSEDSEDSNTP